MRVLISNLAIVVSLLFASPSAAPMPVKVESPIVKVALPLVPAEIMVKWQNVAVCENGSRTIDDFAWHRTHVRYQGGLGITRANWWHYGGIAFAPNAGLATAEQQVIVAQRIETAGGYSSFIPDQNGCLPW